MGKPDVEKRQLIAELHDFAERNGSGHCGDATIKARAVEENISATVAQPRFRTWLAQHVRHRRIDPYIDRNLRRHFLLGAPACWATAMIHYFDGRIFCLNIPPFASQRVGAHIV